MIRIGIIGYGYWGPNIVRNFASLEDCEIAAVCDRDPIALSHVSRLYPGIELVSDPEDLFKSPTIDAIAVVTPVSTHFEFARRALESGKHIFVEKPFTETSEQAQKLIELAEKKNLTVMVDHTFLFTGAVKKIKELITSGALGSLYYYDSIRVNLGLFQHDVNVVWDLAPHDLSIMDYLIGKPAEAVVATGKNHFNGLENLAFITIYYPDSIIAHVNVNWLSPVKVRTTLIGGEKKMLVWNDLEPTEKIKVYDKGVEVHGRENVYDLLVSYRSGDMWAPKLEALEALKCEARYFLDCIKYNEKPINDGHAGLRVVRMLEWATHSMQERGRLATA